MFLNVLIIPKIRYEAGGFQATAGSARNLGRVGHLTRPNLEPAARDDKQPRSYDQGRISLLSFLPRRFFMKSINKSMAVIECRWIAGRDQATEY